MSRAYTRRCNSTVRFRGIVEMGWNRYSLWSLSVLEPVEPPLATRLQCCGKVVTVGAVCYAHIFRAKHRIWDTVFESTRASIARIPTRYLIKGISMDVALSLWG